MTDTVGEGEQPAAAAAWHPDPGGRYEYRWWDGLQWTDQVSTGGVTSTDVWHEPSAERDFTILERPTLSVDFSSTGMERDGQWPVLERDGSAVLGRMIIDHATFAGRSWFEVHDSAGRPLLRLDRKSGIGSTELRVRDHIGDDIGVLRVSGSDIIMLAPPPPGTAAPGEPGSLLGWGVAKVEGLTWRTGVLGIGQDVQPPRAQIVTGSGQPVGAIDIQEPPQQGFSGTREGPSWFLLDRDPEMPEPMRSLTVALIPAISELTRDTRSANRQSNHNRRQRLN